MKKLLLLLLSMSTLNTINCVRIPSGTTPSGRAPGVLSSVIDFPETRAERAMRDFMNTNENKKGSEEYKEELQKLRNDRVEEENEIQELARRNRERGMTSNDAMISAVNEYKYRNH